MINNNILASSFNCQLKFKLLSLLTSISDHILGVFSVKLSHPMMAIPEHETLDSKEVNVDYN